MKFPWQQNNGANQISAERINISVSLHLRILKSAQQSFQQSLEMIIYAFCDFEFSRSQLISIHEKLRPEKKVWIIEVQHLCNLPCGVYALFRLISMAKYVL